MNKLRVLSIIHYPVFIGPHNSNMCLAPLLARDGIDLTVLLPDEEGNAAGRLRAAGVEVLTMPLGRVRARIDPRIQVPFLLGLRGQVRAIRRLLRERGFDVVMLNAMIHPHGAIAAWLEGVPIVWQLIDEYPPMILRRAMMPLVTRTAACVMTTGRHTARAHPGAVAMGSRLITFFPPVDTDRFRADPAVRAAARAELGLGADDLVIGNVANLAPYKDHLTFVRAAAVLRRTYPHARFVILGFAFEQFSEYAASVWREAAALGLRLGENLIVRDPGARVAELAQAFDVFWLTSRGQEGAPTVLCEAAALGLPAVATQVASVPEMIINGASGFVVPPRDFNAIALATVRILGDPELRAAMAVNARRLALRKFDVKVCARLHARAFRLAAERARRALGEPLRV
jgi:glycosyltransferase involved in cell wall biosynthesis